MSAAPTAPTAPTTAPATASLHDAARFAGSEARWGTDLADLVAPIAADLDRGTAPLPPLLRELGSRGLLDRGVGRGTLGEQFDIIRLLARDSLTAAFSVWAHRVVATYVAAARSGADRSPAVALASGTLPGATAMASAFQDLLGLRPLGVRARPEASGLVLDGRIGWASNLFETGALIVLPVALEDGGRAVVAVRSDAPGVTVARPPELLALQSTASAGFTLEGVRVDAGAVLSEDHAAYLGRVRPVFTVLQAAFCLGIADAALDAVRGDLRGETAVFTSDRDRLDQRATDLGAEADRLLARTTGEPSTVDVSDLVAFRLAAARLGTDTVALELRIRGGAGYLRQSATARRLREAAFLPIQSPTEAQLRWEVTRSA